MSKDKLSIMVLGRLKGCADHVSSQPSAQVGFLPSSLAGSPCSGNLDAALGDPHSSTHLVERYRSTLHARPLGEWIALERNVISAALCGLVVGTVHL